MKLIVKNNVLKRRIVRKVDSPRKSGCDEAELMNKGIWQISHYKYV